jgi:ABC-2 type transport system ATP-binding protein
VRKKIGYLPETTALYPDMTVGEYLSFMAELKKVSKDKAKDQISNACKKCGLEDVRDVIVKTLSKGYKQRVGIAQAILGEPDVVILDEPTIGLDPNQIIEIRNLIKELGKTTTVILSTHILQEVSATCDKVVIINEGKIVAVDSPDNLMSSMASGMRIEVAVRGKADDVLACLNGLDEVKSATKLSEQKGVVLVRIEAKEKADPRETVSAAIVGNKWGLLQLEKQSVDLEQIFIKLTGEEKGEKNE